jgi:hypothetical protein
MTRKRKKCCVLRPSRSNAAIDCCIAYHSPRNNNLALCID